MARCEQGHARAGDLVDTYYDRSAAQPTNSQASWELATTGTVARNTLRRLRHDARSVRWPHAHRGPRHCIVTNTPDADLHHLDGRADLAWKWYNCVPLSHALNGAIERIPPVRTDYWQLDPAALSTLARTSYAESNYSRAFGASALGAFIALERLDDPNAALECASLALVSARPTNQLFLVSMILERIVRVVIDDPNLRVRVQMPTLGRIAIDIASVYREWGDPNAADRLNIVGRHGLARDADANAGLMDETRSKQHSAICALDAQDRAAKNRYFGEVDDRLADIPNKRIAAINLGWKLRAAVLDGNRARSDILASEAVHDYGLLDPRDLTWNAWPRVEALIPLAEHYRVSRHRAADKTFALAVELARRYGIALTMVGQVRGVASCAQQLDYAPDVRRRARDSSAGHRVRKHARSLYVSLRSAIRC